MHFTVFVVQKKRIVYLNVKGRPTLGVLMLDRVCGVGGWEEGQSTSVYSPKKE